MTLTTLTQRDPRHTVALDGLDEERRAMDTEFATDLMRELEAGVRSLVADNAPVLRIGPAAIAARMLAAVPRAHVYDETIGPFHTSEGVRTLLGVSRQAVHDRVRRGTLLQVRTSDGVLLYPAFQFDGADVPARLRSALTAFRDAPVDGWAIASWFSVPAEELDDLTPRQWLADPDRDPAPVHQLAADAAASWSAP
jgi:hypothetical protein